MLETIRFLDLECIRLTNGAVTLLVPVSIGPRILALQPTDGENMFAELPDVSISCPGTGEYTFWGGHRLWHAPEMPRRTYLPDDEPPDIEERDAGLVITQSVEPATGLQKQLHVQLPDEGATVIVDHTLINHGLWPVECAPWAITQLKRDGVALVPHSVEPADAAGVRPNRSIVLWPYTDVAATCITWGNHISVIRAEECREPFKIGVPNSRGWLAYHRQDTLFVKRAGYDPQAEYLDAGASSQCYCNHRFLEVETLGPRTTIEPGDAVCHREVWEVFTDVTIEGPLEASIERLADEFNLDTGSEFLRRED